MKLQLMCERCKEKITKENFWMHGIVEGKKTKHYNCAYVFEDELLTEEKEKWAK